MRLYSEIAIRRAILTCLLLPPLQLSAQDSLRIQDIVGSWYGLKTIPGFGISTMRRVEFFSDGSFITKNPDTRGRYHFDGDTVVLPRLWNLKFKDGTLFDGMGTLIREKPEVR